MPRFDLDLTEWARRPPDDSVSVASDSTMSPSFPVPHIIGLPIPPEAIHVCEAKARREALELAHNLGFNHGDIRWQVALNTLFLPVPNHLSDKAILHIDGAFDDEGQPQLSVCPRFSWSAS